MIAARCLGGAERALETALAYAQERVQFGGPIIDNQGVSFPLADCAVEIAATRALTYQVAWECGTGIDRKTIHAKASQVKLYASEMAGRVVDRCVQVLGGRGYMRENPCERLYRDLRVDRIWEGTSEIQRMVIVNELRKRGPGARHGLAGVTRPMRAVGRAGAARAADRGCRARDRAQRLRRRDRARRRARGRRLDGRDRLLLRGQGRPLRARPALGLARLPHAARARARRRAETPRERLLALAEAATPADEEAVRAHALWIDFWARAARDPALAGLTVRLYDGWRREIADTVREGQRAGRVPPRRRPRGVRARLRGGGRRPRHARRAAPRRRLARRHARRLRRARRRARPLAGTAPARAVYRSHVDVTPRAEGATVRRSLLLAPLALLLVLLAAVPAAAGGWATVGLDSTPAGVAPGKPWDVNITVLQHGVTPLGGVTPHRHDPVRRRQPRVRGDARRSRPASTRPRSSSRARGAGRIRWTTASWARSTPIRPSRSPPRRSPQPPRPPSATAAGRLRLALGSGRGAAARARRRRPRPAPARAARAAAARARARGVRLPAAIAGCLVLAAAAMVVAAFTTGDDGEGPATATAVTTAAPAAGDARPRRLDAAGLRLVPHARRGQRARQVRPRPRSRASPASPPPPSGGASSTRAPRQPPATRWG